MENERDRETRERRAKGTPGMLWNSARGRTNAERMVRGRDDFVDVLYRARSSTTRLCEYLDTRGEELLYIRKLAHPAISRGIGLHHLCHYSSRSVCMYVCV